jgi:hypothetical protein
MRESTFSSRPLTSLAMALAQQPRLEAPAHVVRLVLFPSAACRI